MAAVASSAIASYILSTRCLFFFKSRLSFTPFRRPDNAEPIHHVDTSHRPEANKCTFNLYWTHIFLRCFYHVVVLSIIISLTWHIWPCNFTNKY
jgi:hypothetical protein